MTREDWMQLFAEFARIPAGLPEPEALAREIILCTGGMNAQRVRLFAYELFDNLIRAVHALEEIEAPTPSRPHTCSPQEATNAALAALESLGVTVMSMETLTSDAGQEKLEKLLGE